MGWRQGLRPALVLALAAGLVSAQSVTARNAVSALTPTPLEAVFLPKQLATEYSLDAKTTTPGAKITYTWTLTLGCVDTGCPNGAGTDTKPLPDVDRTCDNAKLAGAQKQAQPAQEDPEQAEPVYVWRNQGNQFVWYHGDKGAYRDDPGYGCIHQKMGPHGHQGTVSVLVSDGVWQCALSIEGSNLSTTPVYSGKPECDKIGAPSPALLYGLQELDVRLDSDLAMVKTDPRYAHYAAAALYPYVFRALGPFPGTKMDSNGVFFELSYADIKLRSGSEHALSSAAQSFDHVYKELADSGDEQLVKVGVGFDDLAAQARAAARQLKESPQGNAAKVKASIARMAGEKHKLIAMLPKIDLVPAADVYAAFSVMYTGFIDEQGQISTEARVRIVEQGRAAKQKLERELQAAAGS